MRLEWGLVEALLLLSLPLLVALAWYLRRKSGTRPTLRLPSLAVLEGLPVSLRQRTRFVPAVARLLALVLIVVALAQPRGGEDFETVTTEGIDIVIALDTSGSMLAEDMAASPTSASSFGAAASDRYRASHVNRLQAAKEVVAAFVKNRKADRIGLISFDDISVPRCPPTLDYGVLLDLLAEVTVNDQGGKTAIGTALASAVNRLRDSDAKSRVIILLTDGRNNSGGIEPTDAAEMARLLGVKVYAIGIGSEGEAPYPVTGPFGVRSYRRIRSDIDEATLREVAKVTEGYYFRASRRGELEGIFGHIDELERSEVEVEKHVRHHEFFPPLLRFSSLLACLALVGGMSYWRSSP